MGKGSTRRPGNDTAFRANYDAIFAKKEEIHVHVCTVCINSDMPSAKCRCKCGAFGRIDGGWSK